MTAAARRPIAARAGDDEATDGELSARAAAAPFAEVAAAGAFFRPSRLGPRGVTRRPGFTGAAGMDRGPLLERRDGLAVGLRPRGLVRGVVDDRPRGAC